MRRPNSRAGLLFSRRKRHVDRERSALNEIGAVTEDFFSLAGPSDGTCRCIRFSLVDINTRSACMRVVRPSCGAIVRWILARTRARTSRARYSPRRRVAHPRHGRTGRSRAYTRTLFLEHDTRCGGGSRTRASRAHRPFARVHATRASSARYWPASSGQRVCRYPGADQRPLSGSTSVRAARQTRPCRVQPVRRTQLCGT
jgi:hypothetical protein